MEHENRERLIRIFVNEKPFELPEGRYSGHQLKERTNVPVADVLYLIKGANRHEIKDDEFVEIRQDEHFIAVPGHGGAG